MGGAGAGQGRAGRAWWGRRAPEALPSDAGSRLASGLGGAAVVPGRVLRVGSRDAGASRRVGRLPGPTIF